MSQEHSRIISNQQKIIKIMLFQIMYNNNFNRFQTLKEKYISNDSRSIFYEICNTRLILYSRYVTRGSWCVTTRYQPIFIYSALGSRAFSMYTYGDDCYIAEMRVPCLFDRYDRRKHLFPLNICLTLQIFILINLKV